MEDILVINRRGELAIPAASLAAQGWRSGDPVSVRQVGGELVLRSLAGSRPEAAVPSNASNPAGETVDE